jgi:threonine/homoserine/homoserine lactone efflux protein
MGVIHVTLFMGAVLGLCVLPGPDMMYLVGRSMTHGRKAGAISALGIASAALIHTLVVACGLSVLLSAVPTAYTVIRIAGACYLIYLGIEAIVAAHRSPDVPGAAAQGQPSASPRRFYVQGFTTGLLNPKTTLFFAALLPQFVDPASRHLFMPYMLLGSLVAVIGVVCDFSIATLSAMLARRVRANQRRDAWTKRLCGGLYVGLGLNLLRE